MKNSLISFLLSISLLVVLIFNCYGQNYYAEILKAQDFYQSGSYKESAKSWTQAFELRKGTSIDYYNAACSHALAGKEDQSLQLLREAILTGWNDIDWMMKDSDFNSLKKGKDWADFLKEVPDLQSQYEAGLNLELKEKLLQLRLEDQVIRKLLPDAETRFGRASSEYKWFRNELMQQNDNAVLAELEKLIEKHGWAGISEVGELANQGLWLIVQHAPLDVQKKYIPLLEESVNQGESKGSYLAFLLDRIKMREGEKQVYGSQSKWDSVIKKNVIYPISDIKKVDALRASVGLESLAAYAAENNFLLPSDYKKL